MGSQLLDLRTYGKVYKRMNPENIGTGWWVIADNRFIRQYDTKEEALQHVEFQRKHMGSKAHWCVQYLKITFGDYIDLPYEK